MKRIILASTSPRRKQLLESMGISFDIIPPTVPERGSHDRSLAPNDLAMQLATSKALSVASQLSDGIVIGADTIVFLGHNLPSRADAGPVGEVIGKPKSRADAIAILAKLSGTRHAVITGVCLIDAENGAELVDSDTTWITMAEMSRKEIERYVDSGEAIGKAGAYAIQESGDRYVKEIEGSLSNVVGLPIELLEAMMAKMSAP